MLPRRPPSPYGWLFVLSAAGLAAGGAAWLAGALRAAALVWAAVTAAALVPAVWWVIQGFRERKIGSDVIAALALAGTIAVGEYVAGAIIAVMLTGGRALERRADQRARRDLTALLSLAPRLAHRYPPDRRDAVSTVPADQVTPGDLLLVRPGEVVPVDGRVERGTAVLDEATITGEALPVERGPGGEVRGGTVNAGDPFDLRATTDASGSTYAGIVRLAREAAATSAPFVRLADRYAALFLPLTLALAGGAWLAAGEPVRAVAVLVVATPCPLILAAPIAFVSGLSRCARRGVVVKGGGVLERLARARVLLFDKTGTVTTGRPTLVDVLTPDGHTPDELLRLAASLDQVSPHVLAFALVGAARERGLELELPAGVAERPGQGISGEVAGHRVRVGKADWAARDDQDPATARRDDQDPATAAWVERARRRAATRGALTIFVGVDGDLAGVLLLQDRVRADAARTLRLLRAAGVARTVMVTGDRAAVAHSIAELVGADELHAELTPERKVAIVREESARVPSVMVGDGVNDAPALAAAGVGVALGARGATASSEAADVVITVDRLDRLAETLTIARRTRRVALQSVIAGMGLSLAAMGVAAAGGLIPAVGALVQEGIDIVVIVNALRALRPGPDRGPRLRGAEADLVRRLDEEHRRLWPKIEALPDLAESVDRLPPARLRARLAEATAFLTGDLAEHERLDERTFYPAVARAIGGADPVGPMSRGHAEIAELSRRVCALAEELGETGDGTRARRDLRRTLHELYAVLRLHFVQEEENFFVLAEGADEPPH